MLRYRTILHTGTHAHTKKSNKVGHKSSSTELVNFILLFQIPTLKKTHHCQFHIRKTQEFAFVFVYSTKQRTPKVPPIMKSIKKIEWLFFGGTNS